jgi:hypothetical protein
MKTPIIFLIFKRPDTTAKVFESIRKAKPEKLFIIADGARPERIDEVEKCGATRLIVDNIDWNCEVIKNYSHANLGCAKRVSSGLDWAFEHVEEAIILEDDCVPHHTFFRFCEELLNKYRYDNRIASISGQNVQFGRKSTNYSYYFSRYNHCWGWATWRRAWKYFDFDLKLWNEAKQTKLLNSIFEETRSVNTWINLIESAKDGSLDSWAIRWSLACWLQSGLGIISNVNLVSNIGFGQDSTHLKNDNSPYNNLLAEELMFPLKNPPFVIRDFKSDMFTQNTLFYESKI